MQKVQLSEVCKESYPLDIFGYTHVYLFNKEGEMKPTDIPTQLVIRKENGEEILVNYKECIDFGGQIVIMSLEGNYARNMVTSTSDSTDEGIYLSKEFADYVGISDYKNMTISLSFFVPIGEIEAMYSSFDSNDNLRFSSKSRLPLQVLIEKEFNIIGIRERGPYLSFGSGYDLVFYLPLDTMSKIKKEASIEYSWLFEDEQIKEELQLKEWNTAFYMIVPEKESDIPNVISEIRNINPNFTIVSNNENVNYLANVVKQEQVGFKTVATSVVFVIGLIFVCIYLYSIKQEEWGLTYLKANGLNIGQMVFADLLVNGCLSFYVSVMTLYLYCSFINYKYGFLFMYFSSEAFMFFLSIYSIIISFGYISLKMKILGNFDFSKLNCKS